MTRWFLETCRGRGCDVKKPHCTSIIFFIMGSTADRRSQRGREVPGGIKNHASARDAATPAQNPVDLAYNLTAMPHQASARESARDGRWRQTKRIFLRLPAGGLCLVQQSGVDAHTGTQRSDGRLAVSCKTRWLDYPRSASLCACHKSTRDDTRLDG